MEQITWERKIYESWDDAFKGLAPSIRQQSVRVATYTQVLYSEACESGAFSGTPNAKYINQRYAETAYKCGLYHQLGKALVPQEYQIFKSDFSPEEIGLYRKYTTAGCKLVAALQESGIKSRSRSKQEGLTTDNIPWQMVRDAAEQHMERYNGSGYPAGKLGSQISVAGQIVGLAKELDRLVTEIKSEDPFKEAFDELEKQSGSAFSPVMIDILKKSRSKCRAVYNKFIHYSLALPKTVPLIKKSDKRVMGLNFRAVAGADYGSVTAYETVPWFGAVYDDPGDRQAADEIAEQLKRTGMTSEVMIYLLYEAADTLYRIQNCKLDNIDSIVFNMLPDFYGNISQLKRLNQLFDDQPVDKARLILTLPQSQLLTANKATVENVKRLVKSGFSIMLDEWDPQLFPIEQIREFGFKLLRTDPSVNMNPEAAKVISAMPNLGITVYAKGVDDERTRQWFAACNVNHICGMVAGYTVDEDELIRDSLLRERANG